MESSFDYTSMEDDSKPSERQLLHKMENISDYEPGSTEYSEASLEVAKQLADHVSEDNSDATYEEVMDLNSDAFDMLDDDHLLNREQRTRIEEGDFRNVTEAYNFPGRAYDTSQAAYKTAKMAAEDSKNPNKRFNISSREELEEFKQSVKDLVKDAYPEDSDYVDRFERRFDESATTHF